MSTDGPGNSETFLPCLQLSPRVLVFSKFNELYYEQLKEGGVGAASRLPPSALYFSATTRCKLIYAKVSSCLLRTPVLAASQVMHKLKFFAKLHEAVAAKSFVLSASWHVESHKDMRSYKFDMLDKSRLLEGIGSGCGSGYGNPLAFPQS